MSGEVLLKKDGLVLVFTAGTLEDEYALELANMTDTLVVLETLTLAGEEVENLGVVVPPQTSGSFWFRNAHRWLDKPVDLSIAVLRGVDTLTLDTTVVIGRSQAGWWAVRKA